MVMQGYVSTQRQTVSDSDIDLRESNLSYFALISFFVYFLIKIIIVTNVKPNMVIWTTPQV